MSLTIDKEIYYFSTINIQYDKVWFFEDEKSLLQIDSKYNNSDLLSNSYYEKNVNVNSWHWNRIDIKFKPPFYYAMVCCVRISSNLLSKIRNYAAEHKTLLFLEALFPTICKTNNMNYETPTEFSNIIYRTDYEDKDMQ